MDLPRTCKCSRIWLAIDYANNAALHYIILLSTFRGVASFPHYLIVYKFTIMMPVQLSVTRKQKSKNNFKPKLTEKRIHTVLIFSLMLCVWWNMVYSLQWNFYFTNYGHGRFMIRSDVVCSYYTLIKVHRGDGCPKNIGINTPLIVYFLTFFSRTCFKEMFYPHRHKWCGDNANTCECKAL